MSAAILMFPERRPEKSCWNCVHHISGPNDSVCMFFGEAILSERVAAVDCPEYEEID